MTHAKRSSAKKPKPRYLTFKTAEIGEHRNFSGIFHCLKGWNPWQPPVPLWIKVKDLPGVIVSDREVVFRRICDEARGMATWRPVTGPAATLKKFVVTDLTHLQDECPTCHRSY